MNYEGGMDESERCHFSSFILPPSSF
jgi:hypothetical protein